MNKTRIDLPNGDFYFAEDSVLYNWEKETQKLAEEFTLKVFGKDNIDDIYWVADCVGSVLCVGDHFVDMYRIIEYFRYKAKPEHFFEYYDWELELAHDDKKPPVNFKNFIKYGREI